MSQYRLKVTLPDDDVAEFTLTNATITPSNAPVSYTDYEYKVIIRLLNDLVPAVATANIKKVELEKEA